jgi:DNA (cytosine-5)-methyltransferase 1
MLRHLDLFSGIGGFALAARMVGGYETVGFCEIDPYCQAVLRKHWPDVPIYDDVRSVSRGRLRADGVGADVADADCAGRAWSAERAAAESREAEVSRRHDAVRCGATGIDIITGGFPCQPFSQAGKRMGREDDRHLWPEYRRIVQELRPAWVLGENVPGIVTMELDNVLADLEGLGYSAVTFSVPACAVGAPHIRERIWIVAHADLAGPQGRDGAELRERAGECAAGKGGASDVGYTSGEHQAGAHDLRPGQVEPRGTGRGIDPDWWLAEPDVGRVAHGVSARVDRLRALGNAIIPQVAAIFLQAIKCAWRQSQG